MTARVALLDTSALIKLASIDSASLPLQLRISAVTLAELTVGPLMASTDTARAERLVHLQYAESDFDPIPFDTEVARVFGGVASDMRARGRKVSARTYDAMIAATAISHDFPLVTANPNDFAGIKGLEVIAV